MAAESQMSTWPPSVLLAHYEHNSGYHALCNPVLHVRLVESSVLRGLLMTSHMSYAWLIHSLWISNTHRYL